MDPGLHIGFGKQQRPQLCVLQPIGAFAASLTGAALAVSYVTGIVASLTRTGTGVIAVTFKHDLPDTNYFPQLTPCDSGGGGIAIAYLINSTFTKSGFSLQVTNTSAGNDVAQIRVMIFR